MGYIRGITHLLTFTNFLGHPSMGFIPKPFLSKGGKGAISTLPEGLVLEPGWSIKKDDRLLGKCCSAGLKWLGTHNNNFRVIWRFSKIGGATK